MASEEEKQHDSGATEVEGGGSQASRARNRTVMLTPEITGEVRARLAQDMASESGGAAPVAEPTPAPSSAGGFQSPTAAVSGTASPAAPSSGAMSTSAPHGAAPVAQPVHSGGQGVIWSKPSKVAGFLVSYDDDENGEVYELRMGRLIVTSEPPGAGNFLVLEDETVSSMHAIVRMASFGEVQILDQLSEYGTRIIRADSGKEEDLSGDKSVLHHGDTVFFGERKFSVCLVPSDADE